jgi:phage tail-like protein
VTKDRIAALLPYVIARTARKGSVLDGLLSAMEGLHEPSERVLADLDAYADPRRCPDRFVPMLARWVGLEGVLRPEGSGRAPVGLAGDSPNLRELVARRSGLSRLRGTARGLIEFLEIATGVRGFEIEEGRDHEGRAREFHFTLRAPAGAGVQRRLIEHIVELEKPAHVTCDVAVAGGRTGPGAGTPAGGD